MTDITDLQMQYNLSPALAKLLLLLLGNKVVTVRMVEKEHKLATDARIAVHRLRRRLDGTGIVVQSRRDVGYWLDATTRAGIAEAIDQESSPTRAGPAPDAVPAEAA